MDLSDLFNVADKAGVILMFLILAVGGAKRWWVFGWVQRSTETRETEWKQLALTGTKLAEQVAARTHEQAVAHPPTPTMADIVAALRVELGERERDR